MRTWSYSDFVDMLMANGFERTRNSGATRVYQGTVGGKVRLVTVHWHAGGRDIPRGTLRSMIRQSGLPKKLFR